MPLKVCCYVASWVTLIVSILDRLYFGTPLASEDLYISGIKGINQLSENPLLLSKMSKNARQYSEKRTSIKKALTNYQAFFDMRLLDIDNELAP